MIFERIITIETNDNINLSIGISGEQQRKQKQEQKQQQEEKQEEEEKEKEEEEYCFLFLHGMGSSKYTWYNQIMVLSKLFLCIVPDLRGHGNSSNCENLSMDILVNDVINIIIKLNKEDIIKNKKIIIICHSVGGLIGTNLALNNDIKEQISAVIVLDLVEETGIESLSHMKIALLSWPVRFHTIEQCIEFSVNQHRPQNHNSAQISIPSLLVHDDTMNFYTWKTPLLKYESNWLSWFDGFDNNFLSLTQPHCLILASIDRLDRVLSGAHMQGLFELHIVHGCNGGHFIQEDHPDEILGIIVKFLKNKSIITSETCLKLLTAGLTTTAYGNSGIGITGINSLTYHGSNISNMSSLNSLSSNGLGRYQIHSPYSTRTNWS